MRENQYMGRCEFYSNLIGLLAITLFVGCGLDASSHNSPTASETAAIPASPQPVPQENAIAADVLPYAQEQSALEQEVFEKVNEERAKVGLKPLAFCKVLADCARAHSNDMHDRGFFAHINPDGWAPSQRAREGRAGSYTFEQIVPDLYYGIAENIAMGCADASQVINLWMNSPSHKANILSTEYTHIGVGVCSSNLPNPDCKSPLHHWTLNFGTQTAGNY